MTIIKVKEIVEKHFKVDISLKRREHKWVIPRFIYYDLCRNNLPIELKIVGKQVNSTHSAVINGASKLKGYLKEYPSYALSYKVLKKEIKDALSKENEIEEIEVVAEYVEPNLRDCELDVLSELKEMSDSDISLFIENRLIPFKKMLASEVIHKVNIVKGAVRNHTMKI